MTNNNGVLVTGTIKPFSKSDKFATAEMEEIKGGYKVVDTIQDAASIPMERREEFMTVYVRNQPDVEYHYLGGINDSNLVLKGSISVIDFGVLP